MQPSRDEKKTFLLWVHASYAFSTVIDICEQILNKPISESDSLYNHLMIAIYTAYGRPFTMSRGIGKMTVEVIPDKFKELHIDLITHRDKLHAHADKDMVHEIYGPANELRVTVSSDGRCQLWTQPIQPSPQQIRDILRLARHLHKKMNYWTDKFVQKHMQKFVVAPGDYLVDTESETELLRRRDDDQANRERIHVNRVAALCGTSKTPHP